VPGTAASGSTGIRLYDRDIAVGEPPGLIAGGKRLQIVGGELLKRNGIAAEIIAAVNLQGGADVFQIPLARRQWASAAGPQEIGNKYEG